VKQPPPPPPTPAPKVKAAPKEFLVFFDFDSDKLTPEAMEIVRSAAQQAKAGGYSKIRLTGYTDRAGPAKYNLGLSLRRADSVKAELKRLGVPEGEITARGLGEANPLVPTADGVPEAQNRRVEIFMQ
jgi:outer membrane protein OmpA-like peptidoglycan-associated protein